MIPILSGNESPLPARPKAAKSLRGIKTTTDVVTNYLDNLFNEILTDDAGFLESLATPFLKDPLKELTLLGQSKKSTLLPIAEEPEKVTPSSQVPVMSVESYLNIERNKEYVLLNDSDSETQEEELEENASMLAEWENIHNKVFFDVVNDNLDEYRPYGLKGPPPSWSDQTRALTYRFS